MLLDDASKESWREHYLTKPDWRTLSWREHHEELNSARMTKRADQAAKEAEPERG